MHLGTNAFRENLVRDILVRDKDVAPTKQKIKACKKTKFRALYLNSVFELCIRALYSVLCIRTSLRLIGSFLLCIKRLDLELI